MLLFGDASETLTPGAVQLLLILALAWWWCPRWVNAAATGKLRTMIGLVFVWAWVFSTPAVANLALVQLEGKQSRTSIAPEGPAIYVVMGAGTPAGARGDAQLTLAGWRRLEAAVAQWRLGGGQLLLVGGLSNPTSPETTSLAATMGSLVRQWGVPENAIIVTGHKSQNTREDLQAVQVALGQHKQGTTYLVTSAAHMPRSIGVANALGLTLEPLRSDWRQLNDHSWRAWFPNNGGPALWRLSLYELLGTTAYNWRGWL